MATLPPTIRSKRRPALTAAITAITAAVITATVIDHGHHSARLVKAPTLGVPGPALCR